MALDTENMNIYKVETDNDIYNVVRNYDINKLFDKLIVPNATKEQLKDNLKKALNEKNNDEALRILNYLLKYKHNYYKRNDILLDDESSSSQEKTITLKDAGYYEITIEAASAKSPWFNKAGENFEHFLVKGSPWTDSIPNKNSNNIDLISNSQKSLYLLKNFNYILINKTNDNVFVVYIGNYELNDKGCFLFKKYQKQYNELNLRSLTTLIEEFPYKTYQNIETAISGIVSSFEKINTGLLDYFEYNSSAFAAYGSRQIFLETFKTLLYSKINLDHKVYLKGSKEDESDLKDIKDNIIFDDVYAWTQSSDATYEQKHYYNNFVQTNNLSPSGESAYLSKIIRCDANSPVAYKLQGFEDDQNTYLNLKEKGEIHVLNKPIPKEIDKSNFDKNYSLSKKVDHKNVGLIYGFDYDTFGLNSSFENFIGGGKKGYGPHMNHQDNCYWCNGEDAHIKIRYLGDNDSILKRVFFQNGSYPTSGKRISLSGEKSALDNFNYIDVPSGSTLEFKYKCSSCIKSLNFDKCFVTILKNNSSVYNSKYSTYGYEAKLDIKTVNTNDLLSKLNKSENILFNQSNSTINLSEIYQVIGNNKWTMSELFFNNSHLVDDCEDFIDFKIDKDWNYYTISFKVFDNMILDFGDLSTEVEYYNNVILDSIDESSVCNEQLPQKEYFNKSNTHDEKNFIKELSFTNELQDRILDDNLNTLYNKNYNNTVSFDSDNSGGQTINSTIFDTERDKNERLDKYHDYRVFCELFEKIYITIKSGNQINLLPINHNISFGDYEQAKYGYITNFYFKRTAFSEEQIYNKRISVKQGEFIYFKCEYNSCRVEIDKELSSMPIDTVVYPVNYDPFKCKYYPLNPADYDTEDVYKGYPKSLNSEGRTFQWIRFTTSNSSYDIIIFLKKITVEINFLSNLFGEEIVTKNFSSNKFEPNENFSFSIKLPKICRISNLRYSEKETYSYIEDEKILNPVYFNENYSYESFISFYSQNSKKVIKNFKDYVYSLPNILLSYTGSRQIFELFKNTFSSLGKKTSYFSDETISFSLNAKYADSHIRISEDYIIGSTLFENFQGKYSDHILCEGIYRFVGNSGNTGNGGKGGDIIPEKIYATILSGSGGGGLYGGDSGKACQNSMISPLDGEHWMLSFQLWIGIFIPLNLGWIGNFSFWLFGPFLIPNPRATMGWTESSGKTKGTIGITCWTGIGSGCGGQGFYGKGHTAGEGSWFLGVLKDTLVDEGSAPLNSSYWELDEDWPLNRAFEKLVGNANNVQKSYFINCFSYNKAQTKNNILQGADYFGNNFNERYRGAFFDTIIEINSEKNNKIVLFSNVGSSGNNGLDGENSKMNASGIMESMPKDGICGQEGRPTHFEFDSKSYYRVISSSYFTNINDSIILDDNLKLNKGLLCGGVHDVQPQKSIKIPKSFNFKNGYPILGWMSTYHKDGRKAVIMAKDEWNKDYFKVDTFKWDHPLNQASYIPKEENTFSSILYASFTYFWFQLDFDLRIINIANPLSINILEGFKYLINPQDNGECMGVKFRPKLLPFCWDTKSHTAYTISNSNSKLSYSDINDDPFTEYSPTKYLNFDNNNHFRSEYPFIFESNSNIDTAELNNMFYKSGKSEDVNKSYGERYNAELKTSIYNFINCYNNLQKPIWTDQNIFKNDTLCVSNIGLTRTNSGEGRLLKLKDVNTTSPATVRNSFSLSKSTVSIMKNHLYKCIFQISNDIYELPIDGFDEGLCNILPKILTNNITIINDSFVPFNYNISNIAYSSEVFSKVFNRLDRYGNPLNFYDISEVLVTKFKNTENLITVFRISKKSKSTYEISHVSSNLNRNKFILEIVDTKRDNLVLYNSLKSETSSIQISNINDLSIKTSYNNLKIKKGNDYYIIIYDKYNYLYGNIQHNNIIDGVAETEKTKYLNYFLEYTTSRGRIPIISTCLDSLIFLGRNPEKLNSKDAENVKLAYIYSGNIYTYRSAIYNKDTLKQISNINLSLDLEPIDDNSTCVALIDYKHLCHGDIILNQSNSDWLKI